MELKEALLKRRSVRKFTTEDISDEIINELLHAAMSGPSACNKRPWKFLVVKNKELLLKLRTVKNFDTPLAIIVCGDLSKGLEGEGSEYWIQDCSAATENILLRVTDLGLGAVWCGIHPISDRVNAFKEILNLDDFIKPLNIIYIGYPDEEKEARDQYDESCVTYL